MVCFDQLLLLRRPNWFEFIWSFVKEMPKAGHKIGRPPPMRKWKPKKKFFVQKKEVFGLWNQFRRRHIKVKSNLGFLPHIKRSRRKKISWTQFFGLEIKRHWCLRTVQLEIIGSSVVLQTKRQGFEFRKRETVAHFCIADVHKAQF